LGRFLNDAKILATVRDILTLPSPHETLAEPYPTHDAHTDQEQVRLDARYSLKESTEHGTYDNKLVHEDIE
jgi:hypothetical protein